MARQLTDGTLAILSLLLALGATSCSDDTNILPPGKCNDNDDCSGGEECDAWSHDCVPPGDANRCEACVVDGDCDAGYACAEVSFEGTRVGTYCARDCGGQDDLFCGSDGGRTVGLFCQSVRTRAGVVGDYCGPTTTTCEAYLLHNQACDGDGECSADGDGPMDDAACRNDRCTFPCDGVNGNCPFGYDCGAFDLCETL